MDRATGGGGWLGYSATTFFPKDIEFFGQVAMMIAKPLIAISLLNRCAVTVTVYLVRSATKPRDPKHAVTECVVNQKSSPTSRFMYRRFVFYGRHFASFSPFWFGEFFVCL